MSNKIESKVVVSTGAIRDWAAKQIWSADRNAEARAARRQQEYCLSIAYALNLYGRAHGHEEELG